MVLGLSMGVFLNPLRVAVPAAIKPAGLFRGGLVASRGVCWKSGSHVNGPGRRTSGVSSQLKFGSGLIRGGASPRPMALKYTGLVNQLQTGGLIGGLTGSLTGGLTGGLAGGMSVRAFSSTSHKRNPRISNFFGKHFLLKAFYYTSLSVGITISVVLTILGAFFIYDATTYFKSEDDYKEVEVSQLALEPVRGGPKNLPICYSYLDSEESPAKAKLKGKPRLVVLGTGWGSVALLKEIDPDLYDITIISPTNYFLFTPMLPSATVGTLDLQSLVEPIRRICSRVHAHFLTATAEDVVPEERLVEVKAYNRLTNSDESFYVPYDKLVIGVGSTTNTHGVSGLEYCDFLKTVQDARNMRGKIVANLEQACLPTTSDEERKRLLSFVVCGGGPTGVELAAEIYDLLNEDLAEQYPKVIRNEVSVHVIQSRSHILNTYDENISNYAMERFKNDNIDVQVNSRVDKILPDKVVFYQKGEDGKKLYRELPYGLCVWSTGVDQAPITKRVVKSLGPENQRNKRAIETDTHLRVFGTPQGDVYAIGDCATMRTNIVEDLKNLLRHHVLHHRRFSLTGPNRVSDEELANISITYSELEELVAVIKKKYPQTTEHLCRVTDLFNEFDIDRSGTLSLDELTNLVHAVDERITSLPATAQRANQQGAYLGRKLTRLARAQDTLKLSDITDDDIDEAVYRPFAYKHLGSLAYISNAAVFDFNGKGYVGGLIGMYLWRGAYFAQTVSFRTRVLMAMGWVKRGLFGRDLSSMFSNDTSAAPEK
ncbi:NADH-ubiquinone reductase (H(+)-translocating) NDE1 [Sugiyamaella lignohabitans]|uniref:NADH-ubiquinone reductase (H(+)-translocating) NDE1 n=1 Tax=Sugiyamaella lignohabitans TaxID=796027 RepID=A0A167F3A9_9ASCO|nr:NADH-ubiquinone reductase (H(+)-translocating) NDE1 [Sugiyamaella lignohabitans]ANB14773.1 NADH-ubiquinone reductase (H(+)-translocating) NDE1 [Sugiyamaella lignohabitans]